MGSCSRWWCRASTFFREISPIDFFTGTEWAPLFKNAKFGVLPLLSGTLVVTLIAALICLPLGLLAAIYLSEYAARRTRSFVKPILEILAGIPTVVYGFFALTFVTPLLRDNWLLGTPPQVFNALSAGLVMGIMILPDRRIHFGGRHVRGAAVPARRCSRPGCDEV